MNTVAAEAGEAGSSRQTLYSRIEERRMAAAQIFGRIWAIAEASADNQLTPGVYNNYLQQPGIYMGLVLRLAPKVDTNKMAEAMSALAPNDLKIDKLTAEEQTALVLGEYHEKANNY